jgi:hypothetical protein
MALRAEPLAFDAIAPGETAWLGVQRAALWSLLVSKLVAGWGVQWDIQWHVLIGRDSFWIPPHLMTYAGVTLSVLVSFGILAWGTLDRTRLRRLDLTVLGLRASPGFHLAAWGIALTVLAAPIDDLWHRLFGLDVTLWSPPHLLGIVGAAINTLACLVIAREVYPAGSSVQALAMIVAGGMLYGNLHLLVDPSNLVAYRHGGVLFHTLAILSAVTLPLALVPAARLSKLRWAPVLVLLVVILSGTAGAKIAEVGFAWLEPASVIQAEIAKDPTSSIALAYTIARKNGTPPGRTGGVLHLFALLPAAAMALIDARRRPVAATLGYALGLFMILAYVLTHRPAFAPMAPGPVETSIALGLTLVAGAIGGAIARRLSDRLLERSRP